MARITIEDCMEHVPNRFHLVRMASVRAKQLKKGAVPLLTSEDNKQIVMSLREIAAGLVKVGSVEPAASDTSSEEASVETGVAAAETVQAEAVQSEEVAPADESDESTSKSED